MIFIIGLHDNNDYIYKVVYNLCLKKFLIELITLLM